ncbi:MAG: hypothetical protein L0K86_02320 [Actinomycetia bacterium]|nr:hypothetical protein [Actinomycetes bacterium]
MADGRDARWPDLSGGRRADAAADRVRAVDRKPWGRTRRRPTPTAPDDEPGAGRTGRRFAEPMTGTPRPALAVAAVVGTVGVNDLTGVDRPGGRPMHT